MNTVSKRNGHAVSDWWSEIDDELLALLEDGRPASPADLGRRLGLSEAAASSLLWGLASEGKIRIRLVERACS
jgi:DNA-binding Lrp family transcriptional regulator